jgi:vitamin B12 transporter
MKTAFARYVLLFIFVLVSSTAGLAQSNSHSAHLSGKITDASGYAVQAARISLTSAIPNQQNVVGCSSDATGEYGFEVAPGEYVVVVERSAFVNWETRLTLAPGETRTLDARLVLARLSDQVVVTATTLPQVLEQSPAPVDLITSAEIEQRQSVSLPDLLATQTGVTISRTGRMGGLADIFVDGGDSTFSKVLIDGAPVNEPGGALNYSNLNLDNVDKVEIIHGAESALYGTDAVSGVVQVLSHRGTTRIPEVALFSEGGSYSSGRGGGQISGVAGSFDYSLAGSYFSTNGQGINDAFINRSMAANLGYSFSPTNHLGLTVRSNSSEAGTPGQTLYANVFPPDPTAYDALKQLSATLNWTFQTGPHWTHQLLGTESRIHDTNAFPDFAFFATDQFNRASLQEQSTYVFRSGAATAGYFYEVENAYPSSLDGLHARRNNQAGFLDAKWRPLTRLTLSAGARAEANASFGTRVVPRAGAVVALRYADGFFADTRARFSYGEGIEEPSLPESFSTDPCNPGNPGLRPEQSETYNAGIDQYFSGNRLRVSATYFDDEFRNLISETPAVNPNCLFGSGTLFNTDRARARGVNLSTAGKLRRWLTINANYSHDDSRVLVSPNATDPTELPGNHLLRRPVNSGNVMLNTYFRRFSFTAIGYFTGVRTDSDFDGLGYTRNPGYCRFDVATSYEVRHGFAVYGRVTNILDKQYQDALGYPALGRDFRIGLKYRFNGRD